MSYPLWLRCENKAFERRAALTPTTCRKLIANGYSISVERDEQRIFDDQEYEDAGCTLVSKDSWSTTAPLTTPIIGLKELPASTEPLKHTHIHFAHCYKRQEGWRDVLKRFYEGKGKLYDLEFLQDASGRRVAAFGFHAGFTGAAAGLLAYAALKNDKPLGELKPFSEEKDMISAVKEQIAGRKGIKALVIGALGRCGRGAVDLFLKAGLNDADIIKWDMDETARGGPFDEILDVDIFINCIYLSSEIRPFLTPSQIQQAGKTRRLSIVVDVSCDTTNPYNPIPIYTINTTFKDPTVPVNVGPENPPMQVISIDHLPTLLPRESSEQFSADLLPSLLELKARGSAPVWRKAEALFEEKMHEAISSV